MTFAIKNKSWIAQWTSMESQWLMYSTVGLVPDHVYSDVYVFICHNLRDWKIVFEHTELGAGGRSALRWGILKASTVLIIWIYDPEDISWSKTWNQSSPSFVSAPVGTYSTRHKLVVVLYNEDTWLAFMLLWYIYISSRNFFFRIYSILGLGMVTNRTSTHLCNHCEITKEHYWLRKSGWHLLHLQYVQ